MVKPTMTATDNKLLIALATVWKWDGDLMACRSCRAALVASRDGEELRHRPGCKHIERKHPWAELREIIV